MAPEVPHGFGLLGRQYAVVGREPPGMPDLLELFRRIVNALRIGDPPLLLQATYRPIDIGYRCEMAFLDCLHGTCHFPQLVEVFDEDGVLGDLPELFLSERRERQPLVLKRSFAVRPTLRLGWLASAYR